MDLGRLPIRIAIRDPKEAVEELPLKTVDEARVQLRDLMSGWPKRRPRLAIEADTGIGKTTLAVEFCAAHVLGEPLVAGAILVAVHDRQRVEDVVGLVRAKVAEREGNQSLVTELLGRQRIDVGKEDWTARRFGCANHAVARRSGSRGRLVHAEVCKNCPVEADCNALGYLGHTKRAHMARVLVTTMAKLTGMSKSLWECVGAVICDEDVMPGLFQEFWVLGADLRRAQRHIRRLRGRIAKTSRTAALLATLPLLEGSLTALSTFDGKGAQALVNLLPEECERFATEEGLAELARAMPRVSRRTASGKWAFRFDERAPATWERSTSGWTPRQVWGRWLTSFMNDLRVGDGSRTATVRVVRAHGERGRARLHVLRFDARTLRMLRERPLLLMDATLHPAITPVLGVERRAIHYDQGRKVVQVLTRLLRPADLTERLGDGWQLSAHGRVLVSQIAAWFSGHRGYVLCRKRLAPLLRAEAARYHELRRAEFVTPKRERGWDADERADVFVVLGTYAKNGEACLREAHALRSVYRELTGSTAGLDALERPLRAQMFRGRGVPLRFRGELVERVGGGPPDLLAALLQDADRVATVRQFVGRDRTGKVYVLLLRGDPTIGADALVEARDLAIAIPAVERRRVGGRTLP